MNTFVWFGALAMGLLHGILLSSTPVSAAMRPHDMQVAFSSLGQMAFDLKDLVNTIQVQKQSEPVQV